MPITKPRKGQSKKDFIASCMSELSDEFKDTSQRYAVCMRTYENAKKSKGAMSIQAGDDEFIYPGEDNLENKE